MVTGLNLGNSSVLISNLWPADLYLRGFSYDGGKPVKYRSPSYENAQRYISAEHRFEISTLELP